jgi:DNA mismatch endonuclease (patch repair protein)
MSRIRSSHTKPELAVRRVLHGLGYRFRLHAKDLRGTPDIVFRGRQAAIFVHGCFWHGHGCRVAGKPPQSNISYWVPKIDRNRARDGAAQAELEADGWRVLVLWECEVDDVGSVSRRLREFLGPPRLSSTQP